MVSSPAATVVDYLSELAPERRAQIDVVRDAVNAVLPAGYREGMAHGMIGWVIPLADYPDTYNRQPLVYAGLAAQKNSNSLYLNCLYASAERPSSSFAIARLDHCTLWVTPRVNSQVAFSVICGAKITCNKRSRLAVT